MDRRLKNISVHDRLGERVVDENWANHREEDNEEEYVWQEGQWTKKGAKKLEKKGATPK